jgi:murein L,D-transpeptidase YafK
MNRLIFLVIFTLLSPLYGDETEDFLNSLNHKKEPTPKVEKVEIDKSKKVTPTKRVITPPKIDSVLVIKSESRLYLLSHGKVIKDYRVSFGKQPEGHKLQEGDQRTPEGNYTLDYKKRNSTFHRAIHISYPNKYDRARAKKAGVNAGGLIMLHGQTAGELDWFSVWAIRFFDWTDGCIAVTNEEIDEIYSIVKIGTPIEIRP